MQAAAAAARHQLRGRISQATRRGCRHYMRQLQGALDISIAAGDGGGGHVTGRRRRLEDTLKVGIAVYLGLFSAAGGCSGLQ